LASAKIIPDAFSAIIAAGICALPVISAGIEQSTTHNPAMP